MCDFDLDGIEADAEIGYIVECNLEYPPHLHHMHNDYPLAPEHLTVTRDMLSPFAVSLLDPNRPWKPTKKLVPNLSAINGRMLEWFILKAMIAE